MIFVVPYFNTAVILGLEGMVPVETLRYTETEIVCALIVSGAAKPGFWVNVVLVVPVEDSSAVCTVVVPPVATGSTLFNICKGSER